MIIYFSLMKKEILNLFFILLFFISSALKAQIRAEGTNARITLNSGEELSGIIKDETLTKMNSGLKFKSSTAKEFVTYAIRDFRKLQFESGETYEVLEASLLEDTTKRQLLGALILKGYVSVYETFYNDEEVYIAVKNGKTYWLQNDELIGFEKTVKRHSFKNVLFSIIQDGGISGDEVEVTSFSEKNILALITKYNTLKNSNSELFKHKTPNQTFIITSLNSTFLNQDDIGRVADIAYRLYSPRTSTSMCVNIGIQYVYRQKIKYRFVDQTKLKYQPTYSAFSIPIILQKNILSRRVRPYLKGGIALTYLTIDKDLPFNGMDREAQKSFGFSMLYGAGLEVDLYKGFMVKSGIQNDPLQYLFTAGIAYNWRLKQKQF